MQWVKDLYEQLDMPGQQKMWLEVRKRNIGVSRHQVFDFVARQGERQVFTRPLPKAEGKTASEDLNARYMIDVVNFRENLMVVLWSLSRCSREKPGRSLCQIRLQKPYWRQEKS